MSKIFFRIFLCIFIECFAVSIANGESLKSVPVEPSTTTSVFEENNGYIGALSDYGASKTTTPIIISGTPENTTAVTLNGTLRDIKTVLHHRSSENRTPLLVHVTLENSTYLLVYQTPKDSTQDADILVYAGIENETYILIGILDEEAASVSSKLLKTNLPSIYTVVVDFFGEIVDKIKGKLARMAGKVKNISEDLIGKHLIIFKGVVSALCPEVRVSFLLYTKSNPKDPQILKLNESDSIRNSNFDSSKNTTVLVHGWGEKGSEVEFFAMTMKDAILKNDDRNVIVIGWPAKFPYTCSLGAMKPVAKRISDFLQLLIEKFGVDVKSFHVMGHGLGAHIAGFSGQYLTVGRLQRITGFDPARPLIDCSNQENCIDKSDGNFVDIIHTNGGFLGKSGPLGHVDFYPNGGKFLQPNCGLIHPWCSHMSSFQYYAEAISAGSNGTKFYAAKSNSYEKFKSGVCSAMNEMGPDVNEKITGTFYLITRSDRPYALGLRGLGQRCLEALNNSTSSQHGYTSI